MTDTGKAAFKASILYTLVVLMVLAGVHVGLEGSIFDGGTAFIVYGCFLALMSLWMTAGIKDWPSQLPSPWHG